GRNYVTSLKMRFMLKNIFRENEELLVTSTDWLGRYWLGGGKDEWGKTIFFTDLWFPCSGPIFNQCINATYHAQCDAHIERIASTSSICCHCRETNTTRAIGR
ncbi:hypothetical protein PFISCL1PPCAC_27675, partial [Pristionchus fissidentatus]